MASKSLVVDVWWVGSDGVDGKGDGKVIYEWPTFTRIHITTFALSVHLLR